MFRLWLRGFENGLPSLLGGLCNSLLIRFILGSWLFFPSLAAAQNQAKDCSNAASGVSIGTSVTINCLSKEQIEQVIEVLIRKGVVRRAESEGVEQSIIVSLAGRLKPGAKFDLAQAVVEVSAAVDIAAKILREGETVSGDALLDEVQRRITAVESVHVAAYIEQLQKARSAPTAKLRLAALRHLFDWLVIGQIMPINPAAAVRGPRHIVRRGKTPVLDPQEARQLIDAIDATTIIGLRDRALIGLMVYSFARIGAAIGMQVDDVYSQNRRLLV
jgi:hypothetical protein